MKLLATVFLIMIATFQSAAQSYYDVIGKLHNTIKAKSVLSAKVTYIAESEDGNSRLTKYLYADNRGGAWRAIHIPEFQKTVFFDGKNASYSFYHRLGKQEVHTDELAVAVVKEYLNVASTSLLVRKESTVSLPDSQIIYMVEHKDNGRIELVLNFPGDVGMGIKDKTMRLLVDTLKQLPVQMVDSSYFLERLVKVQEVVDTVYYNPADLDSLYNLIQNWMLSYSLIDDNDNIHSVALQFEYQDLYNALTFINYPPPQSKYYFLDFYYVGCVACLQCLPNIKDLIYESTEGMVSVIAINPYDKMEKIERFNHIQNITYSSASIPLKDLYEMVGEIAYPTFILFDSSGKEILRAMGCDNEFFKNVKEFLSKE